MTGYTAQEIAEMDSHFKEHAAKSAERVARLCKMLALYVGVSHRGYLGRDAVIEFNPNGKGYAGELFILCDNGGEWNVCKINHPWDGRSVAYTAFGWELNTVDQAARVIQYLRGEEVDYAARETTDFCETMFEVSGLSALPSWMQVA